MDFLGIGPGELIMILIIAVVIFGPGKIVEISRGLGKAMNAFRKASSDLASKVTEELEIEEKAKSSAAQAAGEGTAHVTGQPDAAMQVRAKPGVGMTGGVSPALETTQAGQAGPTLTDISH